MITPKEKARDLVNKFTLFLGTDLEGNEYYVEQLEAKQCALIAVDEMLKVAFFADDKIYNFYLEVKQEIEKL